MERKQLHLALWVYEWYWFKHIGFNTIFIFRNGTKNIPTLGTEKVGRF